MQGSTQTGYTLAGTIPCPYPLLTPTHTICAHLYNMVLSLDILSFVMAKLTISDLLRWAQTSRANHHLVRGELRARHRRMLGRFLVNPESLLNVLSSLEGVISGSFALNYYNGDGCWDAEDLDIYVPYNAWGAMCSYLTEVEGYMPDTAVDRDMARCREVVRKVAEDLGGGVLMNEDEDTFQAMASDSAWGAGMDQWRYSPLFVESGVARVQRLFRDGRKVDVIQVKSQCALFALTRFWSTLQMNYLTPTGFCAAYPMLTFANIGVLNPLVIDKDGDPRPTTRFLIDKYESRGYQFINNPLAHMPIELERTTASFSTQRGFCDAGCFTLRFDTAEHPYLVGGAVLPSTTCKVGWLFGGVDSGGHYVRPKVTAFNAVTGEEEEKSRFGRFD